MPFAVTSACPPCPYDCFSSPRLFFPPVLSVLQTHSTSHWSHVAGVFELPSVLLVDVSVSLQLQPLLKKL